MSFTNNIKTELSKKSGSKIEYIAELSGFLRNNSVYTKNKICFSTENISVAKKIYIMLKETYDIKVEIKIQNKNTFKKRNNYLIVINKKVPLILTDLCMTDDKLKRLPQVKEYIIDSEDSIRAYLRGAFLARGSINDPKTSRYHMEIITNYKEEGLVLQRLLNNFYLNSKIISREKGYMIYLKEAEKIGDFIRIINANNAVMYFEDIRIYRDHKNMTNRLNNCEQANTDKVVETANKQIEDINLIINELGIDFIEEKLKEVMEFRLKYPDASLQELSEIITIETNNSITKSGLSHRFKKIENIAKKIKET